MSQEIEIRLDRRTSLDGKDCSYFGAVAEVAKLAAPRKECVRIRYRRGVEKKDLNQCVIESSTQIEFSIE